MGKDKFVNKKIAIIGAGNMGQAIAQGLLSKKVLTKDRLFLTDSKTRNNKEAVQKADIIILAVKPQMASTVLKEIKDAVKDQFIISIMAGITINTIQSSLVKKIAIVRVMPNLAAKVGHSMSVWVRSREVTNAQTELVATILEAIGMQLELQNENQINAATAISGSGTAYFFYLTELLEKGAIELGFSQEEAKTLAMQTLLGSANLLISSSHSAKDLRDAVTSKGGTTEAAFKVFKKENLDKSFQLGIKAAYNKAKELNL